MMLRALIIEQLEEDGTLRVLRLQPSYQGGDLVVAFADEYEEDRLGPFHFLDPNDAQRFSDGFAKCQSRKLSKHNFYNRNGCFHVKTGWAGIPTERQWLSYYALSLPEFAIPLSLSISDPHIEGREYRRRVTRDDKRQRYIIYLECASSIGRFDFDLACDYKIDAHEFFSQNITMQRLKITRVLEMTGNISCLNQKNR